MTRSSVDAVLALRMAEARRLGWTLVYVDKLPGRPPWAWPERGAALPDPEVIWPRDREVRVRRLF